VEESAKHLLRHEAIVESCLRGKVKTHYGSLIGKEVSLEIPRPTDVM
jgi:hypothetical protein